MEAVSFDLVTDTNATQTLFLFGGATDQRFVLDKSATLGPSASWTAPNQFELKDSSGTLIFFGNLPTNSPPVNEFYRTTLVQEQ